MLVEFLVVFHLVKILSSNILLNQRVQCYQKKTITKKMKNSLIKTIGRHDPCVGIRAVPVGIQ